MSGSRGEAAVIGAGPNGLAGAITLAEAGYRVSVYEAAARVGGGARTEELTLPGFRHDVCSSVYPLGVSSPFFRARAEALARCGLRWVEPAAALAHPFDDGSAVVLGRSLEDAAGQLGEDGPAVARLLGPLAANWQEVMEATLAPPGWPRRPLLMLDFARQALLPATVLARRRFRGARARAVLAGHAAHALMPLESVSSGAFGMLLWASCHTNGWPFAAGGAQAVADAMAARLRELGGEVMTGREVEALEEIKARPLLCDIMPGQLARLAGGRLSAAQRNEWGRERGGVGVFKVDWALSGPAPWNNPDCAKAGTLHLGGTMEEIAASEREVFGGRAPARPFVLFSQPSRFDATRAPAGAHTAWAYCHVPQGSRADMLEAIEAQVERFAAGFRGKILARSVMGPAEFEAHNANLAGGDIGAGAMDWRRLLFASRREYRTPLPGVWLCGASTPPGPGVHGMCGYWAARQALRASRQSPGAALPDL